MWLWKPRSLSPKVMCLGRSMLVARVSLGPADAGHMCAETTSFSSTGCARHGLVPLVLQLLFLILFSGVLVAFLLQGQMTPSTWDLSAGLLAGATRSRRETRLKLEPGPSVTSKHNSGLLTYKAGKGRRNRRGSSLHLPLQFRLS